MGGGDRRSRPLLQVCLGTAVAKASAAPFLAFALSFWHCHALDCGHMLRFGMVSEAPDTQTL